MFRCSKFQKVFDSGKRKFFFPRNINVPWGRVLFKMFTISCIIFPCLFIIANFGCADEGFEPNHGDFVTINSSLNDVRGSESSLVSERVSGEKPLLFNESRTKVGSGYIELNDSVKIEGIFVPYPSTEECADNSKSASNKCYFVGTKVQF